MSEFDAQQENAEENAAAELSSERMCWRCALRYSADAAVCPHCAAPNDTQSVNPQVRVTPQPEPLKVMVWSYGLLLATTIFLAFVIEFSLDGQDLSDEKVRATTLLQMLVVEVMDSVIVGIALFFTYKTIRSSTDAVDHPIVAWVGFLCALPVMLALNITYHWMLTQGLQLPLIEDELTVVFDGLVFVVYCVQPALVEEIYCRRLVLGVLGKILGHHSAIWISSIMFGLLHVGVPLSIPYLILLGAFLGYAKCQSGGIALPVVLHFIHNLVVLLWV